MMLIMSPTVESDAYISRTTAYTARTDLNKSMSLGATHDRPMEGVNEYNENEKKYRNEFFQKLPCIYSNQVFLHAATIFDVLKHDFEEDEQKSPQRRQAEQFTFRHMDMPHIEFIDDHEKRLTFQLVFNTLKYQTLLEKVFKECMFFTIYPELREDRGLVFTMVYDYQTRKFQQRNVEPGEPNSDTINQVENAILQCKTKLNASLARRRIKASALSLDDLLPDAVKSKEEVSSKMLTYLWVNQLKTSVLDVIHQFKDEGYMMVSGTDSASLEGLKFSHDHHCYDMLIFPTDSRAYLTQHQLNRSGHIVLQDKSSCIAPHTVKCLINDDDDIVHVNAGSGVTTAHIVSLMRKTSNHIWAFGANSPKEAHRVNKQMEHLGVKNVKVMQDRFLDMDVDDSRFKNTKVVLVTADCSKSGITNPVDFVVNEGEDMRILRDLSVGELNTAKMGELIAKHSAILKHALRLSKVQAVVYMSRSIHECENVQVVGKAMEFVNLVQQKKTPYRLVPPVLPFLSDEIDGGKGVCGKFIKFQPSQTMCGCFVAIITRELQGASSHEKETIAALRKMSNVGTRDADEMRETSRDIIARAKAKGLMLDTGNDDDDMAEMGAEFQSLHSNGDSNGSKLLRKRSRKSPRRLKGSNSSPQNSHVLHSKSGVSTKQDRHGRSVNKKTNISSASNRLHVSKVRSEDAVEKVPHVSEHLRVIQHPAPFR